jgi:hypothetical protein
MLNSTPLGEVIGERELLRQRNSAGWRIGEGRHVDLFRYVAWLVRRRHAPSAAPATAVAQAVDIAEAARGSAAAVSRTGAKGRPTLSHQQERLIAALLTEPTQAAAAKAVGISEATLYRWLRLPEFQDACCKARRNLVDGSFGRIQAATGQAVETLMSVSRQGRRDSDRIRASMALLNLACRGPADDGLLHGRPAKSTAAPYGTRDVVRLLSDELRAVEQSEMPTAEKARLLASLADALLRAINVDELEQRIEALQKVLLDRKNKEPS